MLDWISRVGLPAGIAIYLLTEFRATLDHLAQLIQRSIVLQETMLRLLERGGP